MLEKLLSQSTEQDNPSRLVIEAAHGSASKVRELVQKYPDKVSAALHPLLLSAAGSTRAAGGGLRMRQETSLFLIHFYIYGVF